MLVIIICPPATPEGVMVTRTANKNVSADRLVLLWEVDSEDRATWAGTQFSPPTRMSFVGV